MATEPKNNAGFTLPEPQAADQANTASSTLEAGVPPMVIEDTSSRDLLIGGAILLVLFVAFFFAKNAYANGLVAKKLSPDRANASGWWLFIFLSSLATGVVLAGVNAARFMAPMVMGPVAVVALAALLLTFTSSRN